MPTASELQTLNTGLQGYGYSPQTTLGTGTGGGAPTGSLPRFLSLNQMSALGGSPARFQPASSLGSLSPQSLFANFGNMGQPTSGVQSALQNVSRLGSGLGAINSADQFISGLTGGAPMLGSLGSGLSGASSVLGLAGPLSSFFSPSRYGPIQGALGMPGAIGSLAGLVPGVSGSMLAGMTAMPAAALGASGGVPLTAAMSGALPTMGGSIGAAGAGMASEGLGAGLAAGGGGLAGLASLIGAITSTLALPLTGASIGVSNLMKKDAQQTKRQTIESGDIRRGLAEAVPNVLKAMETARGLDRINALPPDQQIAALQDARGLLQKGVEDLSVDFSRFISTGGQGGRASLVGKVPTGDAERLAAEAWPDVIGGLLRVQDALAQRGVVLPASEVGPTTNRSPEAMLNFAKSFAGAPGYRAWDLTPQQIGQVAPGNLEQFFVQQLMQANPQFAQSVMGQRLGTLPTITAPSTLTPQGLQGVMQQYIGDRTNLVNAERQGIFSPQQPAQQRAIAESYGSTDLGGGNAQMAPALGAVNNLGYLSPYTEGGIGTLVSRLPEVQANPALLPLVLADYQKGFDLTTALRRAQQLANYDVGWGGM